MSPAWNSLGRLPANCWDEVGYIDRQDEGRMAGDDARMRAKSRSLGAVDGRKRGRSSDEY